MGTELPDPSSSPDLFQGVLARRVGAVVVDGIIMMMMIAVFALATLIVGVATLGLGWLFMPLVAPVAVILYYAATLGSSQRATIGMRLFDIVLTPTGGKPLDGWKALIHPVVFWLTISIFWPLLFICLFTPRRQLLHDLITGTMMVRMSPMSKHWADTGSYA